VSSVEASHFDEGTAYVTLDGHRSADLSAWVFKTDDFGKSWTNITNNIPHGEVLYVIREDLKNKNLLFVGSEFRCFVSMTGGQTWSRLMNNMPTVAFHDLVIHPRDGDLIAGTHGRSLWILDDMTPLQQLTDEVTQAEAHIFDNRPMTIWKDATRGGVRGHMFYAGENPPYIPRRENIVRAKLISGGIINYYLQSRPTDDVVMEITDIMGKNIRHLVVSNEPGINRAWWDFRFDPSERQRKQFRGQMAESFDKLLSLPNLADMQRQWLEEQKGVFEKAKSDEELNAVLQALFDRFRYARSLRQVLGRKAFAKRLRGRLAGPGEYVVRMNVNGKSYSGTITVRPDPMLN